MLRCKDYTHLPTKKQAISLTIKEEEQVWELEIPDHSPKTLLIIYMNGQYLLCKMSTLKSLNDEAHSNVIIGGANFRGKSQKALLCGF